MSKLITPESVATAAQCIVDRGGRVSVRSVIDELGGGSPNAVSPLINEWKANRSTSLPVPDIAINPAIIQLIARQVSLASTEAAREADTRAAEVIADAEVIAAAGRAAEDSVARLQIALNGANERVQQLTGQLEERALEIQQVRKDCAEQVAVAQGRAQSERETAEAVRQDLVRAQIRVEAVPRLEAENAALQERLREAENAVAAARQAEAVASAKQVAEGIRAKECMDREKLALAHLQRLEAGLDEARLRDRAMVDRSQQLERDLVAAQTHLAAFKVPAALVSNG